MKKSIFLLIFSLIYLSINAQELIYERGFKNDSWKIIGKYEEGCIFRKSSSKRWILVGKLENDLFYEKRGKNGKWRIIGKFHEGNVYKTSTGKSDWQIVGKYENRIIYKKKQKTDWKIIGKCNVPYGAALLILLNEKDYNDVVI